MIYRYINKRIVRKRAPNLEQLVNIQKENTITELSSYTNWAGVVIENTLGEAVFFLTLSN